MTPTREPLVGLAERLRERMAAASEQPWVYRPDKHDDWGWIRGVERDSDIGRGRPIVAIGRDSDAREESFDEHRRNRTDPYGPNALLIVDGVNALPDLLTALEAQSREIERLRGLLIDPGDPAWEDARGILATEMRKAGHCLHADYVEAAHPAMVPSWLVLNLIAQAARTALSPSNTVEKGEGA